LSEIVNRHEPHPSFCEDQSRLAVFIMDNNKAPDIDDEPNCPKTLFQIMKLCWQPKPQDRPSMEKICKIFNKKFNNNKKSPTKKQERKTDN